MLVTPVDVAKVPWEGDTSQQPVFYTSLGSGRVWLGPMAGRGVGAGRAPNWVLTHWLPCPGPSPGPGGGLVLRLDRKTNEFHYGIAILFHVSGSPRLTCSPGCDKPRHPRAHGLGRGGLRNAGHRDPAVPPPVQQTHARRRCRRLGALPALGGWHRPWQGDLGIPVWCPAAT